ncbi:MAG: hypothetical protein KAS32_25115 [Candidatus Peribacteraceae bacterium]|nr:hypothetical protein [Candidatus Peribacteraceae bacterium]
MQTIATQDYPGTRAGVTFIAATEVDIEFTGYDNNCVILVDNASAGKTIVFSQDGTEDDEEAYAGKLNVASLSETLAGSASEDDLRPSAYAYADSAGVITALLSAFAGITLACVRIKEGFWWFDSALEKHVQDQT